MRSNWILLLTIGSVIMQAPASAADLGTAFTYQGFLESPPGTPVTGNCDFEFTLYEDAAGTMQVGTAQSVGAVGVSAGVFTVGPPDIDFGDGAFNGAARWLKISVCCPSACAPGGLEPLSPLVELTPAPHALALPGFHTQQGATPSIIGGHEENAVESGVVGGTIGGGGSSSLENAVFDDFGTVSGGNFNWAGSDDANTINARYATVAGGAGNRAAGEGAYVGGGGANTASGLESSVSGGRDNMATGSRSAVSGGIQNQASGLRSAVTGGNNNTASGSRSVVVGGSGNTASGDFSLAPGGLLNTADGDYSLAAGQRAQANHNGSFVWSDTTTLDPNFFSSTGPNQYLIRAAGGVGINTNAPTADLEINCVAELDLTDGTACVMLGNQDAANLALDSNEIQARNDAATAELYLNPDGGDVGINTSVALTRPLTIQGEGGNSDWIQFRTSGGVDVWHLSNQGPGLNFVETNVSAHRLVLQPGGNVGIGTSNPAQELDVVGDIHASGTIISGSSITIDGTAYTITSDADLELHGADGRAFRIDSHPTAPNIIGGHSGNTVTAGVISATIAGGGRADDGFSPPDNNRVTDSYGTVGGGWGNQAGDAAGTTSDKPSSTVGGGLWNTASGGNSTVGGGQENTASGQYSTVGGGQSNTASGGASTVGGGQSNTASAGVSTVGGGQFNTASAVFSTVPGGYDNVAAGTFSLAAGRLAKVRSPAQVGGGDPDGDQGTFVWADSTNADFTSTGPNQFLIRASGGVGINTNDPDVELEINGGTELSLADDTGSFMIGDQDSANLAFDQNEIQARSNAAAADLFLNPGGGNVAVGSTTPTAKLHVVTGATAGALIENSGAASAGATLRLENTGAGGVALRANTNSTDAAVVVRNDGTGPLFRGFTPAGSSVAFEMEVVSSVGRFGINDDTPDVELDVVGDIHYTGTLTDVSDERLKENVAPLSDALAKLAQLRGVYFNMKDSPNHRDVGLIAQNVQQVLPEAVRVFDPEHGYLGVSYPSIIPLLVEAVKETQSEIRDADGVALAAIQGLYELVQEKDCEMEELRSQIEDLKELVKAMAAQNLNRESHGAVSNGGGR